MPGNYCQAIRHSYGQAGRILAAASNEKAPRTGATRSDPKPYSLPLDGAGRLAGDVEGDAVDARDLVDDAVAYLLQEVVWQPCPVRGHRVLWGCGPCPPGVGVGPRVAQAADGV